MSPLRHYSSFLVALVTVITLCAFVVTLFPARTNAQSSTWTTTADFSSWTLTNTVASNNAISLATSGGGSASVATKSAAFPSPGSGPTAVWDTDANLAYIFSGNNDDTNLGIYKYNPANDSLTTFTAEMPAWSEYAAAVWNPTADKAYIFGGDGGGNGDEIIVFDPAANSGNGSVTTLALTLPAWNYGAGAVWNDSAQKAYIFGGAGGVTGTQIYVFDPLANGGLGSITTHSLTLPATTRFNPAVWDPDNGRAYIFGSWGGNGDEIYVFNPTANAGAGSIATHSLALPACNNYMSAVWDNTLKKANIFGGDGCGTGSQIVVFDPAGSGSVTTSSATLPSARNSGAAVWADSNGRSYYFQGWDPDFTTDDILEYNPGSVTYVASGTAKKVFTPAVGETTVWQSVTAGISLNNQTLTLQYTDDVTCNSGLTSTISSVPNSESICIVATLSTANSAVTPSLDDLTLNYATIGAVENKTWTTTADFQTWNTDAEGLPTLNRVQLQSHEWTGESTVDKSVTPFMDPLYAGSYVWDPINSIGYIINPAKHLNQGYSDRIYKFDPAANSGAGAVTQLGLSLSSSTRNSSSVWDTTNNVAYIFGGTDQINTFNRIYKFDPAGNAGAGSVTLMTPTLPHVSQATVAIWNPNNNKAYIFGGHYTDNANIDCGSSYCPLTTILEFDPAGAGGAGSVATKTATVPTGGITTAATFYNPTDTKLYLVGGATSDVSITNKNTVLRYDAGLDSLSTLAETLPTTLNLGLAFWDTSVNRAFIVGGLQPTIGETRQILEYNPSAPSFTVRSEHLLKGASTGALFWNQTNGKAYYVSGTDGSTDRYLSSTLTTYTPSTASIINTSPEKLPMNQEGLTAVWDDTNDIAYIFGGLSGSLSNQIWEYVPASGLYRSRTLTLPNSVTYASSVWDPVGRKAYIFGGTSLSSILVFDPDAASGAGTVTTLGVTLPSARRYTSAIWDSANSKAYIFGGINGVTPTNQIVEFNPAGNGGLGTVTTKSATLPTARSQTAAVWNPLNNRAYVFGGVNGITYYNTILEYNTAGDSISTKTATLTSLRAGSSAFWSTSRQSAFVVGGTTDNGTDHTQYYEYKPGSDTGALTGGSALPVALHGTTAVWNPDINKAYIFGGRSNFTESAGQPNTLSDRTIVFTPGKLVYGPVSTNTIEFDPAPGSNSNYEWLSASYNATLNGEEVTLSYSNDGTCASGFSTDITTLDVSDTLCVKMVLATSQATRNSPLDEDTPWVDDVTISYSVTLATPAPPTPTPSSTPSSTPTPTVTPTPSVTPDVTSSDDPSPTPTVIAESSPDPDPSDDPSPGPSSSPAPTTTPTSDAEPPLIKSTNIPPTALPIAIFIVSLFAIGPPVLEWIPRLIMVPNNFWWGLFTWRKRKYAQSRVVSSFNGQGVPGALVTLIAPDQYNRVIDRTISDKEGKFGFLVKDGTYIIRVGRAAYRFPSKVDKDAYHGESFKVENGQPIQMEIPIDPLTLKNQWWQWLTGVVFKLQYLRLPLLILGTVLTIINLDDPLVPVWVSAIFIAYYIVMWWIELSRTKISNHVLRFVDAKDRPVPFLNIVLTSDKTQRDYPFLTNSRGEVLVVVPKGAYTLQIKTRDGHVISRQAFELKYGIFPKTIVWVVENQ